MHVCLAYSDALGAGGYPRDVRWLAAALSEAGATVTLLARVRGVTPVPEGLKRAVRVVDWVDAAEALWSADVVHVFGLLIPSHISLLRRAQDRGVRTVVSTLSQLQPLALVKSRWKKEIYLRAVSPVLRRLGAVHVFSETEAKSLARWNALAEKPRFVASLGIFPAATYAGQECVPVPGEAWALFMGRNDVWQKGLDVLLEGYARSCEEAADGVQVCRLVIAGQPHGKSAQWMDSFIRRAKLERAITRWGAVAEEQKEQLLRQAGVLIFLSRFDGPPRPIREAITVGTPVAVSYESNMGELVAEHQAGQALSLQKEAVARFFVELHCMADRGALWRPGVQRLRERLAWRRVAEDYLTGYGW